MASRSGPRIVAAHNLVACFDAGNAKSYDPTLTTNTANAQTSYTSSGTYTFEVPVGITSISAVCVGGGGGGGANAGASSGSSKSAGGGGGGGLAYGTFAVTPGEILTIIVGAAGVAGVQGGSANDKNGGDGGNSQVKRSSTILLQGGGGEGGSQGFFTSGGVGGDGGTVSGIATAGGGNGGTGGSGSGGGGGGAGAGGYSGNGGNGKSFYGAGDGDDGAGGGGGGTGAVDSIGSNGQPTQAGGVGILGQGSNGAGGAPYNYGSPGSGGSGVNYGGGGSGAYKYFTSGSYSHNYNNGESGGGGAVRLVYQPNIGNRQYPDGFGTLSNLADSTYSYDEGSLLWVDLSAKKNRATLHGALPAIQGCISFDGVNDYATMDLTYDYQTYGGVQNAYDLLFGLGKFTIEIWASWTSQGAGKYPYFLDWRYIKEGTVYIDSRPYLLESGQSGNVGQILFDAEGNSTYQALFSPSGLAFSGTPNPMTQLLITKNNVTGFNTYFWVNGGTAGGDTGGGVGINYAYNLQYITQQLSIGRRYAGTDFLDGKISMIRIYKNKYFTADEVAKHYNIFKHRFGL